MDAQGLDEDKTYSPIKAKQDRSLDFCGYMRALSSAQTLPDGALAATLIGVSKYFKKFEGGALTSGSPIVNLFREART